MRPNIRIVENFITDPDSLLSTLLSEVQWESHIRARQTASYGIPLNYSGITYPVRAMRPDLGSICSCIFSEVGWWPNNCLLNLYQTGSRTMGFHVDDVSELCEDTGVVIISLGAEREITYRLIENRDIKVRYSLPKGSFLHMGNDVQKVWKHGIQKSPGAGVRISLTFRKILPPIS